jgi:nucleoside diphosphate kinase
MFGPSRELVEKYAAIMRSAADISREEREILADYLLASYGPDAATGRPNRVLMLLFEGEDAIAKVASTCGRVHAMSESGQTVRDTFGDFILDPHGNVRYVEPAIMTGRSRETIQQVLRLWAEYSGRDGGLIIGAVDAPARGDVQKTLVLIKPDNFRFPSARPGNIIDLFSGSGLRIIGAKIHSMSPGQGLEFYGPVRDVLRDKLREPTGEKVGAILQTALEIPIGEETRKRLGELIGPEVGDHQFYQIIEFMTGYTRSEIDENVKNLPGKARCLALVYAGVGAVDKIRKILGPTDPRKAQPGSVRREFGTDIMVNAAHASDSPENAAREMQIIRMDKDLVPGLIKRYYG